MPTLKDADRASEHEIQAQILNALDLLGVFAWRNNTGCVRSVYKGRQRFIRYGKVGSSDIFAIRRGIFYGIEVKNATGKQSPKQAEFQRMVEKSGGRYILARSLTNFMTQFIY
jgi:hypothetical protein